MLDKKTIAMLSTLSRKEWSDFGQYLQIKKGSKSQLFSIYKYLLRYHDNLDTPKVSIEHLTKHLKLAHQKLTQNQIYRFRESLINFLVIEQILAPPKKGDINVLKERVVLKVLQERGLNEQLNNRIQKVKKKLHTKPRDRWYHLHLLELYDLEYFHSETEKINKKKANIHIADAMQQLEFFYTALKLRYGAELLSRNNIIDEKNKFQDINEQLDKLTNMGLVPNNYHLLFHSICRLIESTEIEDFQSSLAQFQKTHEGLAIPEKQTIHSYLLNFAIQQVQQNNLDFLETVLSLYEFGLANSIFLENNTLSSTRFCNIIDALAKLGKFERAHEVIKTYSPKLNSLFKKETVATAKALILFQEGKFGDVIKILARIKSFSLPDNDLRSRWLRLCCFYEINAEELLLGFIRATEVFLKRNESLGQKHKEGTRNLIKFIRYLLVPIKSKKRKTKNELLIALNEIDPIFFKTWLLDKISKL